MTRPPEDTGAAAIIFSATIMLLSAFFVSNEDHADAIRITGGAIIMLAIVGWIAITAWRHR